MICAFLLFLFTFAEIRVFSYINTVSRGPRYAWADLHAGLDEVGWSLQAEHLTFVSLILFSLAIGANLSGDLISHFRQEVVPSPGRTNEEETEGPTE